MPGTSIDSIDYDKNEDTAATIDAVLNEVEQEQTKSQPPQYNPLPPPPQYQAPPQPQYQPQPPPPQYYQPPPQHNYPQQPYYQTEHFEQPKQMSFSFTFPDSLKKSLILFVLLLLLTNSSFKNILTKIPMTINGEGQHTFIMTLIVALIVSVIFFIISSVF